eukprot:5574737-Lingulodinium_polyedra.AAC.1
MPDEGAGRHELVEPLPCAVGEDALVLVHGVPKRVAVHTRCAGEQLEETASAARDALNDALAGRRGSSLELADLRQRRDQHFR